MTDHVSMQLLDDVRGVAVRTISVAIADDDAGFRDALVDVFEADDRFSVVGVAATGEDIIDVAASTDPDVVLLDVQMPRGGAVAARALTRRTRGSSTPVVVALSAQTGAPHVLAMLRAGALGYLVKGRVGIDLPDLVARCAAGDVVLAVPGAAEAMRQLAGSHP